MATTTKTEDRRVMKLPKVPLIRKVWLDTTVAHREAFGKASTKRGKGWAKLLTTVPVAWLGLLVWVALVLIWSCVLGWVDDLHRFFKDEDDSDLRRKLAVFRWLSLFNTALLVALLAFVFPAAFPLGVMVLGAAVTNRVTAQVWKSKSDPFAPKTGFVKKAGDRYAASVIERDGQIVGSWWWRAASASLLAPTVAFTIEGLKAPELAAYGLIVPDGIRNIAVAVVALFALVLAVLGGVSAGRRLRAVFGHEVAFKDALREKLILALGQESASGQKQFMTAEEQGLLRIERSTTEAGGWEITLPTSLWPVLRDQDALKASLRRELDTDNLQFMLSDVWEGHFAIGPLDDEERRIRRNLRESGGLTTDDPGFDDPNGMEEPLPRGFTVDDLEDWDKTAAIAATFAELGLQLVGFNRASNKCIVEAEATATPRARWKKLTTPAGVERAIRQDAAMLARRDRAVVLDLDLVERSVLLSPMLPAVVAERETIATELKADLMKVRIAVTWSTEGRAESIDVETRAVSPDPDAARETWRKVINAIHGGSNGWLIHPDPVRAVTTLVYGEPRSLRDTVPGEMLLPERAAEAWECEWHSWPIGLDATGRPLTIDLLAGPHIAAAGGSGAGKSTLARLLMTQAILHGFEVVATDPAKRLGGLLQMVDFTKGMYISSIQQTAEVLKLVFAEVTRRVELTEQCGGEDWTDLPAGTVRPWLVFIDEWANNIDRDGKLGSTAKGTQEQVEWEEKERAIDAVISLTGKIAAQARSAGIHLVMMSQTASTNIMPTGIRNNLGTTVQLKGKKPVRQVDADMLFPGQGAEALAELKELADGYKGLGVALDAEDVMTGFRVGLLKPDEVEGILEARGARKPDPLMPGSAINPRLRTAVVDEPPAPAPQPAPSSSQDDDWLL